MPVTATAQPFVKLTHSALDADDNVGFAPPPQALGTLGGLVGAFSGFDFDALLFGLSRTGSSSQGSGTSGGTGSTSETSGTKGTGATRRGSPRWSIR